MIPRFTPSFEHNGAGGQSVMRRADAGEWVRYADYLAMEARVATLEGQVGMLHEDISELRA